MSWSRGSERKRGGPGSQTHEIEPVVVRRRAGLSALLGLGAAALAAMYLWRAADQGGILPWLLGAALAAVAILNLVQWVDARTPLLVADETGVRVRFGDEWHGLLWADVADVAVQPARGLRDGFLVVRSAGESVVHATGEGAGRRSARARTANERRYGAPLAVPLGFATVVSADDVEAALAALRRGAASDPNTAVAVAEAAPDADPVVEPETAVEERGAVEPETEPESPRGPLPTPLRVVRRALRADITRRPERNASADDARPTRAEERPAAVHGMLALAEPLEEAIPRGNMSLVLDRPAETPSTSPHPREPAHELRMLQRQPATVIGSRLVDARLRLGLSVDELAARTRIRPHVIDAIEVDDFVPCAGDFYARGHLRTLCRVLGLDPEPVLLAFEERHASAPVEARKVFEAELATGASGAIRGVGDGGPRWGALVSMVLVLLLVWTVASYLTQDTTPAGSTVPALEQDSGGLNTPTLDPRDRGLVPPAAGTGAVGRTALVRLRALGGDSRVRVRSESGKELLEHRLRDGQTRRVSASEALLIRITDPSVVQVLANHRLVEPVVVASGAGRIRVPTVSNERRLTR